MVGVDLRQARMTIKKGGSIASEGEKSLLDTEKDPTAGNTIGSFLKSVRKQR
jgi:hypothetical protein